jgi:hypothetical protein
MRCYFLVACAVWLAFAGVQGMVFAQAVTPSSDPESLEELLEFIARDNSISPQFDLIEHYVQQPLLLRTAQPQDLTALSGLPMKTARAICAYARTHPQASFDELGRELRLSAEQLALLKFCTRIGDGSYMGNNSTKEAVLKRQAGTSNVRSNSQKTLTGEARNEAKNEARSEANNAPRSDFRYRVRAASYLVQPKGFTNGAFQGDGLALYQRLQYSFGSHAASVTVQKDAGERSIADFVTGFASTAFGSTAASVRVVAGDFLVFSGMGTLLWSAFGARKGADVIAPAAQTDFGVKPYRSVIEQQFFRGVAAQGIFALSNQAALSVMAWASSLGRAATVDTVRDVATSLDFDGYFRTTSEIAKRNALQERSAGAGVELRLQADAPNARGALSALGSAAPVIAVGGTAHVLDYSLPVVSRSLQSFFGQQGVFASLHASASAGASFFAAEVARDGAGNLGGRLGLQTHTPLYEAALAFRSFPAAFRAPFGYNFGESSRPTNEQGVYVGGVWKGWERLRVASYLDLYTSVEPTSTVPVPVRGVDVFSEWRFELDRRTAFLGRMSYERKTDATTIRIDAKTSERVAFGRERAALRLEVSVEPASVLRLRARMEGALVAFENIKPTEGGAMAFVEASWKPLEGLRVTARTSVYRTASFESAIYQFEPHVAGVLANTALYGTGARYLLLAGYEPSAWLAIWLRGEATVKSGVSSLGSGQLEIPGGLDARVTAQMEIRL